MIEQPERTVYASPLLDSRSIVLKKMHETLFSPSDLAAHVCGLLVS
jgi:hypothetical protein